MTEEEQGPRLSKPMGEKQDSWLSEGTPDWGEVIDRWKREDLSPEESTILRSTSITGRRTTVESCLPTPDNV